MIKNATAEVHAARKRHRREIVERTRLRRLIQRTDELIARCESTHLQGVKEVTEDIREQADRVYTFARRAVRLTGNEAASEAIMECCQRRQNKITEVMDVLWSMQEIVFDLMLPWRTELPEDVADLPGVPTPLPWRVSAA